MYLQRFVVLPAAKAEKTRVRPNLVHPDFVRPNLVRPDFFSFFFFYLVCDFTTFQTVAILRPQELQALQLVCKQFGPSTSQIQH